MNFTDWQELSPRAAAQELLRRAGSLLAPEQRKAAIAVLFDEDRLAAEFAAAPAGSPLRGVPFLLKDLFDVAGMPTWAGSIFLPEVRGASERDGAMMRDLRNAGAVLAGKAQMVEFAWGITGENPHYGDCEVPGHPGRTTGGSSSGSAAVVAADIVPLSIGSDTGGSVRVPASFCGLYGFRAVPRHPWIADGVALAPSFDTAGWFTRTAADMRTTLAALLGVRREERAPRGYFWELPGLDGEVAQAFRAAAASFAGPVDVATRDAFQPGFARAVGDYVVVASAETAKIHAPWADRHRDRYGPSFRWRLDRARQVTPAQIEVAEEGLAALRACWADYFKAHDFLILPATPFPALTRPDFTEENRGRIMALTAPVSIGGLPVLTLPVPLPSGLTTGLQIVAKDLRSPVFDWALRR